MGPICRGPIWQRAELSSSPRDSALYQVNHRLPKRPIRTKFGMRQEIKGRPSFCGPLNKPEVD